MTAILCSDNLIFADKGPEMIQDYWLGFAMHRPPAKFGIVWQFKAQLPIPFLSSCWTSLLLHLFPKEGEASLDTKPSCSYFLGWRRKAWNCTPCRHFSLHMQAGWTLLGEATTLTFRAKTAEDIPKFLKINGWMARFVDCCQLFSHPGPSWTKNQFFHMFPRLPQNCLALISEISSWIPYK